MTEIERLKATLKEIAEYTGYGPATTPWQDIVTFLGEKARAALAVEPSHDKENRIPALNKQLAELHHPTHDKRQREWEALCSAEVEDAIREIDCIYGDGEMTDKSLDWGRMRDIAQMVVEYRRSVSSAMTESKDTARLDYLNHQSGIIASVFGPGWDIRFPQMAGARNLREAIDAMLPNEQNP